MKKTYKTPIALVLSLNEELSILASTTPEDPSKRQVIGEPTEVSGGIPQGIGETKDTPDPFGTKGQDGNSTRAKGSMWDDFDEEW